MKAGGGRIKGNAFERAVADKVVTAFSNFGITKKDCYRTPSSGGHRYAKHEDPGDLVLSKKLLKYFPFHVECKNHRKIELWPLLVNGGNKGAQFSNWLMQVSVAGKKTKRSPMLVFKSNGRMPIMAAFPWKALVGVYLPSSRIRFVYKGTAWYVVTLDDLLLRLIQNVSSRS